MIYEIRNHIKEERKNVLYEQIPSEYCDGAHHIETTE